MIVHVHLFSLLQGQVLTVHVLNADAATTDPCQTSAHMTNQPAAHENKVYSV